MKHSLLIQKLSNSLGICVGVVVIASLSACASTTWTKQADSTVPIEAIHSGSGSIMSFRAFETSDRLYVAGSANTHPPMQPTHIDIQLVGLDGRILAERTDDLDSPRNRWSGGGRHDRQSYVASFPLSEARKAAKIRVTYHASAHGKDNS